MQNDSQDDEMTLFSGMRAIAESIGDVFATNPGTVGGVTAFTVAMTFFTVNATVFQERFHPSAMFETRPHAPQFARGGDEEKAGKRNVTRFVIENTRSRQASRIVPVVHPIPMRPTLRRTTELPATAIEEVSAMPVDSDSTVAGIQELLAKLGYYQGPVDGLKGPMTLAAIDSYKKRAGLKGIELNDKELRTSMRNNLDVTAAIPAKRPETHHESGSRKVSDITVANLIADTASSTIAMLPSRIPSAEVVKVQAALKAFGNADIVVDGVAGAQTESAIREFQTLFRLPETGRIDGILLDKMRAVGLIQ